MSEKILLRKEFEVDAVASVHFLEYKSDFIFKSEYHDHWRLFYVREGGVEIALSQGGKSLSLGEGDIFLKKPGEPYSVRAAEGTTPFLFAIGFFCASPGMRLFDNRVLHGRPEERALLARLIREAGDAFDTRYREDGGYALARKYNPAFGAEQMTGSYLETLLLLLARRLADEGGKTQNAALSQTDALLFYRITGYYADHIEESLRVETVCKAFSIGRDHLQRIFRKQAGTGAIEYFRRMKVHTAKKKLRESGASVSDVAKALGYASAHHFSALFRQTTGMTPTAYRRSLHAALTDPLYEHIDLEAGVRQMDAGEISGEDA